MWLGVEWLDTTELCTGKDVQGSGCGFDFMLAYGTYLGGPREMRNVSRYCVGVRPRMEPVIIRMLIRA
jgi:hypothetical protein